MSWTMHHAKSEQYASLAEVASKKGDLDRAVELYRLAAEEEVLALAGLDKSKRRTLGITVVSAASLWYKARDLGQARDLVNQWLNADLLPAFAVDQLQNLFQTIRSELALERPEIKSTTDEVLISVWDSGIRIRILFLAANPWETPPIRLDEEIRTIDENMRLSGIRDLFDIRQHWAVRITDLQDSLLRHKPSIVHFSGHGSRSNEILLVDNSGNNQPVSPRVLSQLFSLFKDHIRCVVLNACFSERQAQAIARHVECVVQIPRAITYSGAIAFAASFYQALGFGKNVGTAFALAGIQVRLQGPEAEEAPRLLASKANPVEIVFASGDKLARDLMAGNVRNRLSAAQELVRLPQKHLTRLLIERSIGEPNPTVRHWIHVALGKVGSAEAMEALHRNLEDPDPFASLGVQDALREHGEQVETVRRKPRPAIDMKLNQGGSQLRYALAVMAQGARSSQFPDPRLRKKVEALDQVSVRWETVRRETNGDVVFMAAVLGENGWSDIWTRCGITKGMEILEKRESRTLEELVQDSVHEVGKEHGERMTPGEVPVLEMVTPDVLAAYGKEPDALANIHISGFGSKESPRADQH